MSEIYDRILNSSGLSDSFHGVLIGLVTNNHDPLGLGRVKVFFPSLPRDVESQWARVVSPAAGANRGFCWLPDIDDEVLVCFEGGRLEFPLVLGGLWNGKDKPPDANADGKNNRHVIRTRSGHSVVLDDADGEQHIQIQDGHGNTIKITSRDNAITLSARGDIVLQAPDGAISLRARTVDIQSQESTGLRAGTQLDLQANAQANLRGAVVNIN